MDWLELETGNLRSTWMSLSCQFEVDLDELGVLEQLTPVLWVVVCKLGSTAVQSLAHRIEFKLQSSSLLPLCPLMVHAFFQALRITPFMCLNCKDYEFLILDSCRVSPVMMNIEDLNRRPDSGYNDDACVPSADEDSFVSNFLVSEAESVYDYCWYPYMQASDPTTCVFASTTRDHPIHLWDAITGQNLWKKISVLSLYLCQLQLRCTYRAYDAMDEITAAFSVAFNPAGAKLYAGYNKSLRIFDIHRPGRDFKQYSTLLGNKDGQSGIISAIAFSPTHSGMLATGSYSQSTAIYSEDTMELLYVLHGQLGGVTHVLFSKDGNYLYTGGRKDPYILCWDVRSTAGIVYKYSEYTNQRVYFDIEPCGRHLGTGGQDGQVHIYDLQTGQWTASFQAASDTVNGFSFHPSLSMATSSSGHRRFGMPESCEESLSLSAGENCISVWGFSYSSVAMDGDLGTKSDSDDVGANISYGDLGTKTDSGDVGGTKRDS
ncbi:hypothetical protein ACLOJK_002544 [Asimina triloba]